MMKRVIYFGLLIISIVNAYGQEGKNTLEKDTSEVEQLKDVVVSAKMERATSNKTVYIPDRKQKKASQTATGLLRHMAIPQLEVSMKGGVSTTSGHSVSLYIDMMPATAQDLSGMRMSDVLRVEYYKFSDDPRFNNAPYVINFVMQKYEYGGYTKFYGEGETAANRLYGSFYSKMTYKAMVYDLFGGYRFKDNKHGGTEGEELFNFTDYNGEPMNITRITKQKSSKHLSDAYNATFRATYNKPRFMVVNLIGGRWSDTRASRGSGEVMFQPEIFEKQIYDSNNSNRENSISYTGYIYGKLGKGWTMNFQAKGSYSHTKNYSLYETPSIGSILNNAREDAWSLGGFMDANKKLGKVYLILSATYFNSCNRVDYSGSTVMHDVLRNQFASFKAGISARLNKVYLRGEAGTIISWDKLNSTYDRETKPYAYLSAQYSPSDKISSSLFFQYTSSIPMQGYKTTSMIQENELLWLTGNPDVSDATILDINPDFTWFVNSKFSLNAYIGYNGVLDRFTPVYVPEGNKMIRTVLNSGDYSCYSAGIKGTLRLFDRNLTLSASIGNSYRKITGINKYSKNNITGSVSATYYLNDFNFGIYWSSKKTAIDMNEPIEYKYKDNLSIEIGWSKNDWNLTAMVNNPFRYNWIESYQNVIANNYQSRQALIGTNSHFNINLSVTYTIGYGKKVKRGNEVGATSGPQSAILK
ncbi:MAG: hypothetical protein J6C44_07445 [Muribaculaceae bacterium]|nr:hypothetical protein [Muribaculaceae bacterium]